MTRSFGPTTDLTSRAKQLCFTQPDKHCFYHAGFPSYPCKYTSGTLPNYVCTLAQGSFAKKVGKGAAKAASVAAEKTLQAAEVAVDKLEQAAEVAAEKTKQAGMIPPTVAAPDCWEPLLAGKDGSVLSLAIQRRITTHGVLDHYSQTFSASFVR